MVGMPGRCHQRSIARAYFLLDVSDKQRQIIARRTCVCGTRKSIIIHGGFCLNSLCSLPGAGARVHRLVSAQAFSSCGNIYLIALKSTDNSSHAIDQARQSVL
eukprot:6186512-Pleurochrysis_carterae.AAC.4